MRGGLPPTQAPATGDAALCCSPKGAAVEDRLHTKLWDRSYLTLAPIAQSIREAVRSRIPPKTERVLDLGCGSKPYAPLFVGRCGAYVGVDIRLPSAADVLGSGAKLPFPDGTFDVVLCTQVLEHDPDPEATIGEAHRVLADGGVLILSTHGVWFKHGESDFWRWTDAGLKRVMRRFRAVEIRNCGGQYSCLFQLLNLYADPLPLVRRLVFPLNNVLGLALDRALPSQNLIVDYVVVAAK